MQDKQTTRRQTIEQERGRKAWDNIKSIKTFKDKNPKDKDLEKKYRSVARGLNAMIQINGLGQTLGFLYAKSKPDKNDPERKSEHYYLLEHLTEWMRNHFTAKNIGALGNGHKGLLDWVTHEDTTSADYRRATTECLAFGAWLRRFAEAELEEGDNA